MMENPLSTRITTTEIANSFQFGYLAAMETKWFERAKALAEKLGISHGELAKRMGESPANITRYLNGSRGGDSIAVASKFASALSITPQELIWGDKSIANPRLRELLSLASDVLTCDCELHVVALEANLRAAWYAVKQEQEMAAREQEMAARIKLLEGIVKECPTCAPPEHKLSPEEAT